MEKPTAPRLEERSGFLDYISRRNPDPLSETEEIYEEEKQKFYERMVDKLTPHKTLSPIAEVTSKFIISSGLSKKLKASASKSPGYKELSLPPLKFLQVNSRFQSPHMSYLKERQRKYSISKILKVYQEGVEKSATSKNLKLRAMRDSFLAREYAKEVMKTSEILSGISEFSSDFKKKIYREMKSSIDGYESEKTQVINEFTKKLVLSKSYRLKNLKNSLRSRAARLS